MDIVTSFHASQVPPDERKAIMGDYLALEQARIMRRLLVTRCGLLAGVTALIGLALHWLPPFAAWFSVGVFLTPPVWASVVEHRRHSRLGRRLGALPGGSTQAVHPDVPIAVRKS